MIVEKGWQEYAWEHMQISPSSLLVTSHNQSLASTTSVPCLCFWIFLVTKQQYDQQRNKEVAP
eukprot:6589809-Ditylum_brightwellii.AAC.1